MLAETGMKPMQVIQAATEWAMEAWGKSKEAGTVEAGKRADLLVLNRNPLDDMSATMDIYRVIQSGSYHRSRRPGRLSRGASTAYAGAATRFPESPAHSFH